MKVTGIVLSVGVVGMAAIVAFSMNGSGRQTEDAQPMAAVDEEAPVVETALQQPEIPVEELLPEPEPEPDYSNRMPPRDQLSFDKPIRIMHPDGSCTIYKLVRITYKDGRVEEKPVTFKARLAPRPMKAVRVNGEPMRAGAQRALDKWKERTGLDRPSSDPINKR